MLQNHAVTHDVGIKLKKIREEKGLRQIDLAEKAEIRQGHISRIENGLGGNIGIGTIAKLEKALDLKPGTLQPRAFHAASNDHIERFLASEIAAELDITPDEIERLQSTSWYDGEEFPPLTAWAHVVQAIRIEASAKGRNKKPKTPRSADPKHR